MNSPLIAAVASPVGIFLLHGFFWLIAAIVLGVLWWTRVKNTTALFYDKHKIRATLFLLVPAILCLGVFIYKRVSYEPYDWGSSYDSYSSGSDVDYVPTLAKLWVANYSDKPGKIKVGKEEYTVASQAKEELDIKSKLDQDTLRAWLGDSLVLDTVITGGAWIGNFSDDITVEAEEVLYSENSWANTDDLGYILLTGAGIERFSTSTYEEVYGFMSTAPSSITVTAGSIVRKWDVDTKTDEELMNAILEALKSEGGLEED